MMHYFSFSNNLPELTVITTSFVPSLSMVSLTNPLSLSSAPALLPRPPPFIICCHPAWQFSNLYLLTTADVDVSKGLFNIFWLSACDDVNLDLSRYICCYIMTAHPVRNTSFKQHRVSQNINCSTDGPVLCVLIIIILVYWAKEQTICFHLYLMLSFTFKIRFLV